MRVLADAHALPLATASVDMVVGHPPYPGNGVWMDNWRGGVDKALTECRRVMKPGATGWFLLPDRNRHDRWLYFDQYDCRWEHAGSWSWPLAGRGITWGAVHDYDLLPLILQHSRPGDVILDPFAGRGGIPKLAKRLGRIPVGIDVDPVQFDNGGPYA